MPLQLIEHLDPRHFANLVLPSLITSEAQYCNQIPILLRMANHGYTPVSADELLHPLLVTVQNENHLDLAAIQILKTKMLVIQGSSQAMHLLAGELARRNWTGESLIGFAPSIHPLIERYSLLSHRPAKLALNLRTFQATAIKPPPPAPGSMRLCTPADQKTLAPFLTAFANEINEPSTEPDLDRAARLIKDQRIFFWIDRQPVAIAAWAGPTQNGIRINSVYTPPQFRRKGYASNLVAQLSQKLLTEGRKFCFLNTDQSNPTSNKIYQSLGYHPICDSESWEFQK